MAQAIPVHRLSDLREYFQRNVKRPWHIFTVDVPDSASVNGFSIVGMQNSWFSATRSTRLRLAAWDWISPNHPHLGLDELPKLQQNYGLKVLEQPVFAAGVFEKAREYQRRHSELSLWIEHRLALLDFHLDPYVGISNALHDAATVLRQNVHVAHGMVFRNPKQARNLAAAILDESLEGVAQTVCNVLGKPARNCQVSANMMLPVAANSFPLYAKQDERTQKNREQANQLWQGENFQHALYVAAETKGAGCTGFWVPDIRNGNGEAFPGGATAYAKMHGSTVFKNAIPEVQGFSDFLVQRWTSHLRQTLRERLFVSLPFVVPHADNILRKHAAAVFNVNVDAPDNQNWQRALHVSWLDVATKEASRFMECAFDALRIQLAVDKAEGIAKMHFDLGPWAGIVKGGSLENKVSSDADIDRLLDVHIPEQTAS